MDQLALRVQELRWPTPMLPLSRRCIRSKRGVRSADIRQQPTTRHGASSVQGFMRGGSRKGPFPTLPRAVCRRKCVDEDLRSNGSTLNPRSQVANADVALSRYHSCVAQLVVRQLDDDVKKKLQRRARRHGRSTEEEVREILRNAVREDGASLTPLGSRIAARFRRVGLGVEIEELRGQPVHPAELGP